MLLCEIHTDLVYLEISLFLLFLVDVYVVSYTTLHFSVVGLKALV